MIRKLPHWVITNRKPAFYDSESATAIEQTARLYGKMQELIDEYNSFVDTINKEIDIFMSSTRQNITEFKMSMEQKFSDFVKLVELKIDTQDQVIAEAVDYMKTNLPTTLNELLLELFESGRVTLDFTYNQETESLDISGVVVVEEGDI